MYFEVSKDVVRIIVLLFSPPAPPARHRPRPKPYDENRKKSPLPRALQMEIVNLATQRFGISLDLSKPIDKSGLTLTCKYSKYHRTTTSEQGHSF